MMRAAPRTLSSVLIRAHQWLWVFALLSLAVAGHATAQDAAAGRFIAVVGDVKVLAPDGKWRIAIRNGEIRAGESIVTGQRSLAQLHMSDGGAVSVRADTQLKLDAYRYSGRADRSDNFLVSILKGGFRTITGLIARNSRENYRVATSTMTIGVRGTDFEVVHVLRPRADAAAGTYNRVYDGVTTMQGRTGAAVFVNRDQTAFIALSGKLPPVLVAPPAGLFGKPTPISPSAPPSRGEGEVKGEGNARGAATRMIREAPAAVESAPAKTGTAGKEIAAPLLNPIDSPRVLDAAPKLQSSPATALPSAPATTLQIAPKTIDTSPDAPAISPTLVAPATKTISPTLTEPAPTTISPTLVAPKTTISPTLVAPTTTTISPTLVAPKTTTISPTTTTIIKR